MTFLFFGRNDVEILRDKIFGVKIFLGHKQLESQAEIQIGKQKLQKRLDSCILEILWI